MATGDWSFVKMTRINCIPPSELTNKHLLAEYRELPRVFKLARVCTHSPRYTLGTGHVLFFYNKLGYLKKRQQQLIAEMKRRGFKPNFTAEDLGKDKPKELWGDWEPDVAAMELNRMRIQERLNGAAPNTNE